MISAMTTILLLLALLALVAGVYHYAAGDRFSGAPHHLPRT